VSVLDVCGFFFRDPPHYIPPPDLANFLQRGSRPIYIGFGSIVIDDPAKLTAILVSALKRAGVRAIISKGWSNLGENQPGNSEVFYLGDCPHEWLFNHVSAVIHHGGAGTTACGLLKGQPTLIIPFFGEFVLSKQLMRLLLIPLSQPHIIQVVFQRISDYQQTRY
jgi:UDP:flavonoid glycosyltransferase YjiC (YdhE family)